MDGVVVCGLIIKDIFFNDEVIGDAVVFSYLTWGDGFGNGQKGRS